MQENSEKLFVTTGMRSRTLRQFVKNPDAPRGVIVLVKGMAINGERCPAGHVGISHKFTSSGGF